MVPAPPLSRSLAHMDRLLFRARPGSAETMVHTLSNGDPYFVDLPEYRGGLGGQMRPDALRIVAALYFAAEVEGTYLVSLGEELAAARFTLNLTDRAAALKLEELARAISGDWVGRDLRNQIFARVFGIGFSDPNLGETAVNREFEPRFARTLIALFRASGTTRYSGQGAAEAIQAGVAVQSLMSNLNGRMVGNTLIVAERLSQQLQLTLDALNHPGLTRMFQGANVWDVLRSVLGNDTPDLAGHINRAQTGLRILGWIAEHLSALNSSNVNMITPVITGAPQLAGWTETWLSASGVNTNPQPAAQPSPWQHQASNPWQPTPQAGIGWVQ